MVAIDEKGRKHELWLDRRRDNKWRVAVSRWANYSDVWMTRETASIATSCTKSLRLLLASQLYQKHFVKQIRLSGPSTTDPSTDGASTGNLSTGDPSTDSDPGS